MGEDIASFKEMQAKVMPYVPVLIGIMREYDLQSLEIHDVDGHYGVTFKLSDDLTLKARNLAITTGELN